MSQDTDFSGFGGWTWIALAALDGYFFHFTYTIMIVKLAWALLSIGWMFFSWFWF